MPWPHMARGREPIDPTAPMKAFSIDESHRDSIDQSRSLQINTIQPDKSNDGRSLKHYLSLCIKYLYYLHGKTLYNYISTKMIKL